MAQPCTVYRILVASPSDCGEERRLIPDVIHLWNARHSQQTGVVLEPVLWETHSTPEMTGRPQGIINRQLGEISDLLIATFWTRLGTSTGAADSGTVEEVDEFRAAGKPVLVYFSQVPAVLATVDQDQLATLLEYRKRIEKEGLFSGYSSLAELREKVYGHINSAIEKLRSSSSDGEEPLPEVEPIEPSTAGFFAMAEGFVRRLEASWSSERDSNPHSIAEGQSVIRVARAEVVQLRAQITNDNSGFSAALDDILRRMRKLERFQLYLDGGVSFDRFWKYGTLIVDELREAVALGRVAALNYRGLVLQRFKNISVGGGKQCLPADEITKPIQDLEGYSAEKCAAAIRSLVHAGLLTEEEPRVFCLDESTWG